jgi:hypothetical protein
MPGPIADAVARFEATRLQLKARAQTQAEAIRRDYGLPRERRQWADHPGLWNRLNSDLVNAMEAARQRFVDELAAARHETRRQLYRVPVDHNAGVNRTLAELNYRQAREMALSLPLGETGLSMALERMEAAVLVGDEAGMAALTLVAEARDTDGRTAWARIPRMWEQASGNRYTQERLAELRQVDELLLQHRDPQRVGLGKLTPIAPEPTPAPSIANSDGYEPPAVG